MDQVTISSTYAAYYEVGCLMYQLQHNHLHELEGKYITHGHFLKILTPLNKLIVGWADTRVLGILTGEACTAILNY